LAKITHLSSLLLVFLIFYFKVFFEIFKFKMFFLYSRIFCECTQFNFSYSHYAYSFILIILSICSLYLEKAAQKNFEYFLQQHTLVWSVLKGTLLQKKNEERINYWAWNQPETNYYIVLAWQQNCFCICWSYAKWALNLIVLAMSNSVLEISLGYKSWESLTFNINSTQLVQEYKYLHQISEK
jgi:hypothetical protein